MEELLISKGAVINQKAIICKNKMDLDLNKKNNNNEQNIQNLINLNLHNLIGSNIIFEKGIPLSNKGFLPLKDLYISALIFSGIKFGLSK